MDEVRICGYFPGAIGRVTELHATYYHEHWGLDLNFESEIATGLSEFLGRFDPVRDGFWVATVNGEVVGSIAIDGSNNDLDGARLRWFILAPAYQGRGIGQTLMRQAIDFAKQVNFSRVYLWTFAGLKTARHLYEKWGFTLCKQYEDNAWGKPVTHQMFKLDL